jgi:hypothetical protein
MDGRLFGHNSAFQDEEHDKLMLPLIVQADDRNWSQLMWALQEKPVAWARAEEWLRVADDSGRWACCQIPGEDSKLGGGTLPCTWRRGLPYRPGATGRRWATRHSVGACV